MRNKMFKTDIFGPDRIKKTLEFLQDTVDKFLEENGFPKKSVKIKEICNYDKDFSTFNLETIILNTPIKTTIYICRPAMKQEYYRSQIYNIIKDGILDLKNKIMNSCRGE